MGQCVMLLAKSFPLDNISNNNKEDLQGHLFPWKRGSKPFYRDNKTLTITRGHDEWEEMRIGTMHDDANANGAVFGVKLGIEVFLERCVLKACQNVGC